MKFSLVTMLVATSSGSGSGTTNSFIGGCRAAVPSFVPFSSSGARSIHPTSSKLYLDNLPKVSELNVPNMNDVKDRLATKLSKLGGDDDLTPPSSPFRPSPPPPFDPTDPEALISVTKSFIATDFGIQSSQLPNYSTAPKSTAATDDVAAPSTALPFYSSSLLSESLVWISGSNLDDGRTGPLTKAEYLAAGRYFDLRGSFPDLEYGAHDFRLAFEDEEGGETITVRFTTRTTGTFRGAPLRLRSKILEPNGRVMRCPPTSISITYGTRGEDRGKITKLVTDMVMDRQIGNTLGLSGVPAAAVVGGAPPDAFLNPPLVALGRLFGRPLESIDDGATTKSNVDGSYQPPFPDSVMIQLTKGVLASNFGLNDPNLLAENFAYIEPLMGPMNKEKYLETFSGEYNVREGVPDLDYGLQNFRVDPYDPYRVWVDSRATGTRTGAIGKRALPPNVDSAPYEAPPEGISFAFDDDGFCTRLTAAAVLDPLLGNTGGLGGAYGLLYATGTPVTALRTRSLNAFFSRASKSLLSSVTGLGPDGWKMSDGRIVNGLLPAAKDTAVALPPETPAATPFFGGLLPSTEDARATKPFFASEAKPQRPTIALPKVAAKAESAAAAAKPPTPSKPPAVTKTIQIKPSAPAKATPISDSPADPVTDAFNSAFGIASSDGAPSAPAKAVDAAPVAEPPSAVGAKAQQLRNAAQAARAEAAEAKKNAEAKKAQEAAEKRAALDAKLEKQEQDQLKRQQLAEEAERKKKEAEEAKRAALDSKLEKQKQDQLKRQQLAEEAAEKRKKAMEASKKKKEAQVAASKQQQAKKASPTAKPKGSSGTTSKATSGGGMFSFFQTSGTPSSKSPSAAATKTSAPMKASKSKTVKPAKRSPTISLFGSSKPNAPPSKPPSVAKPKAKASLVKGTSAPAKRSSSISLFGNSSTKTKKATSAIPKTGSNKSSPVSSATPKAQPKKKSPTLNIFGIGGSVKSADSSKEPPVTQKATKTKSPTLSLKKSKTSNKGSSAKAQPKKKSPTLSIFGIGGSVKSADSSKKPPATKKATKTKSPTLSLKKSKSSNTDSLSKAPASRSPTFSLFGGAAKGSTKKDQSPPVTSTRAVSPAKKASSVSNSPFGGFFGGSSSSTSKGSSSGSSTSSKKTSTNRPVTAKAQVAPKGVPALKKWKRVNGNAIEGIIYGSNSFKDGVVVTTSPIRGSKFANGSVVVTESGSKYFLE